MLDQDQPVVAPEQAIPDEEGRHAEGAAPVRLLQRGFVQLRRRRVLEARAERLRAQALGCGGGQREELEIDPELDRRSELDALIRPERRQLVAPSARQRSVWSSRGRVFGDTGDALPKRTGQASGSGIVTPLGRRASRWRFPGDPKAIAIFNWRYADLPKEGSPHAFIVSEATSPSDRLGEKAAIFEKSLCRLDT